MSSKNLNVWVYGAGAVGCYYGARLIEAESNVLFVSRGAQLVALERNGLKVKSCRGNFDFKDLKVCSENDLGKQEKPDLVLVSTKTHSNEAVAKHLAKILGDKIPVFIFQNGIKSEQIFKRRLGSKRALRAVINVAARMIEPGVVEHRAGEFVTLENDDQWSPRLLETFSKVGVPGKLSTDIHFDAWSKTAWNAAFNSVTALTRLTTHPVLADEDGYELIKAIATEVGQLARADGVNLPTNIADQKIEYTLKNLGDISTSTLEDVRARKHIEYSSIVGDLIEEARTLKIEVPHLQTIYTLLKLLDKSFVVAK